MGLKKVLNMHSEDKGVKKEDINSTVYRKINRIIAIWIAKKIASHTKITPNQTTAIPMIMYIACAILFYLNTYTSLIAGGIILLLSYLFDQVNGSLARIKNMANDFGGWIDGQSDTLGLIMIYFGATFGIYNKTQNTLIWIFGFLAVTSYLYGNWTYINFRRLFTFSTNIIEKEKKKRRFIKNFFYNGNLIIPMFSLAAFVNKIDLLLIIFAVYGWLYCFMLLVGLFNKIRKEYKKSHI